MKDLRLEFMHLGHGAVTGRGRACIVARDLDNMMVLATILPSNSGDHFVLDRVMAFLAEIVWQHGDAVV